MRLGLRWYWRRRPSRGEMPPPSNRTGFRPVQRKALMPSIIGSPALGRNVTVPYCRRSAGVTQECGAGFSGGGGRGSRSWSFLPRTDGLVIEFEHSAGFRYDPRPCLTSKTVMDAEEAQAVRDEDSTPMIPRSHGDTPCPMGTLARYLSHRTRATGVRLAIRAGALRRRRPVHVRRRWRVATWRRRTRLLPVWSLPY
jgi:hypothetical protein